MEIIQLAATYIGYCIIYLVICAIGSCIVNHTTDISDDEFFIWVSVIQFMIACAYIGYKVVYCG